MLTKTYSTQVDNKTELNKPAMEQENPATQQLKSHTKNDNTCRVRLLGNSAIVECLMDEMRCQWASHFRDGKICKHPSAGKFVNPTQP